MTLKYKFHCVILISNTTLPWEFLSEYGLNVLRTEGAFRKIFSTKDVSCVHSMPGSEDVRVSFVMVLPSCLLLKGK